jgi:hypothetical protein
VKKLKKRVRKKVREKKKKLRKVSFQMILNKEKNKIKPLQKCRAFTKVIKKEKKID